MANLCITTFGGSRGRQKGEIKDQASAKGPVITMQALGQRRLRWRFYGRMRTLPSGSWA